MNLKSKSSSDARCIKNRTVRNHWICTVCGVGLPAHRKDWGLVWNSEQHGACVQCVHELRSAFGFRFSLDLNDILSICSETRDVSTDVAVEDEG